MAMAVLFASLLFGSFVASRPPVAAAVTVDYRLPWVGGQMWKVNQYPNQDCDANPNLSHCSDDPINRWAYDFGPPLVGSPRLPVVASAAGTVVKTVSGNDNGDCGTDFAHQNWVRVLHLDGTYTEYHHLTSVLVGNGGVEQGQILGTVGCTGHATGVHLHFARINAALTSSIAVTFKEALSGTWIKAVNPCSQDTSQPVGDWNAVPSGAFCARYYRDKELDKPLTSGSPDPAKARYWSVLSRIDDWLDFNWGSAGFPEGTAYDPYVSTAKFGARWVGRWGMPVGTYKFFATSSDGIRVWVDGVLRIDSWIDRTSPATFSKTLTFASGTSHTIRVDYYNSGTGAAVEVHWTSCAHGGC